jgi:hypothetical protein
LYKAFGVSEESRTFSDTFSGGVVKLTNSAGSINFKPQITPSMPPTVGSEQPVADSGFVSRARILWQNHKLGIVIGCAVTLSILLAVGIGLGVYFVQMDKQLPDMNKPNSQVTDEESGEVGNSAGEFNWMGFGIGIGVSYFLNTLILVIASKYLDFFTDGTVDKPKRVVTIIISLISMQALLFVLVVLLGIVKYTLRKAAKGKGLAVRVTCLIFALLIRIILFPLVLLALPVVFLSRYQDEENYNFFKKELFGACEFKLVLKP